MKKNILFSLAVLLLTLGVANAAFKNIQIGLIYTCEDESVQGKLRFIPGAPNGTYSAKIDVSAEYAPYVNIDGVSLADGGYVKEFKIPRDEDSGLNFDIGINNAYLTGMETFDSFFIPVMITPGDDNTLFTGFGQASGSLEVNDTGCANGGSSSEEDEEEEVPDNLKSIVVGADEPSFEDVNTATLISNEVDLKVNFTYKVDATAFNLFTTFNNIEEGDITERAKELASKMGLKLNIKNLKKLARKELKQAGKGKRGEAKSAAIEEAMTSGINRLLSEILLKLPPLPPKGSVSEADREARKVIRKAKKAKILEGLEVELVEITDGTMDGKAVKCLSFKITLPAKICAKEDGSKTLVVAGAEYDLMGLEAGESMTIDIPVKVVGFFSHFFGDENKKGRKNGKITVPLTLFNPAESE